MTPRATSELLDDLIAVTPDPDKKERQYLPDSSKSWEM